MSQTIVIQASAASDGGIGDGGSMDCFTLCDTSPQRPPSLTTVSCVEVSDGIQCTYDVICLGGRRPEGAYGVTANAVGAQPRQRWLMQLAIAELASVPAFHELADALSRHGAPSRLIERADESAQDEMRHARLAFGLARREGGPLELRIDASRAASSSLRELAIHNAKEGCVREAYASLEAAWQAQHACDALTRDTFASIARDEARHAQLSLDIDRWARGQLDLAGRRELDAARVHAASELRGELSSRRVPQGLGLPSSLEATALLAMVA